MKSPKKLDTFLTPDLAVCRTRDDFCEETGGLAIILILATLEGFARLTLD